MIISGYSLLILPFLAHITGADPALCPIEPPSRLSLASVWKHELNGFYSYRISDEDLSGENFTRAEPDLALRLARQPDNCPVGLCSMKLSVLRRNSDSALTLQEIVFGVPNGFTDINDSFYCARASGDCGADVPIWRFVAGRGDKSHVALSLDGNVVPSGYERDPRPICFGWGGDVVLAARPDHCTSLESIANGRIVYSTAGAGSFSVGTTATLKCLSGYAAGGQSEVLCTKNGWYPNSGLGYCVSQNHGIETAVGAGSIVSSSSATCATAAPVTHGQILYSQLGAGGRFPSGTTATVSCLPGYTTTTPAVSTCSSGIWQPTPSSCIPSTNATCPPLLPAFGSQIIYDTVSEPHKSGTVASLQCPRGTVAVGSIRASCRGVDGWEPKTLGSCQLLERPKRQTLPELPCGPVLVFSGKAQYSQTNQTTPFASGSSVVITCDSGFVMQGGANSVCQNGVWTPPTGACVPGSSSGVTGGGTISTVTSSGAQCTDFIAPLSGSVTYSQNPTQFGSHPSGTTATLSCNSGSTVSGALSATCANGVWSPVNLGTCSSSNTNNLECPNPTLFSGTVTYSQSTSSEPQKPIGTVAYFQCNSGFHLSGTSQATCTAGGTWQPTAPTCILGSVASGSTTGSGQCIGGIFPPLGGTVNYCNGAQLGPYPAGCTATLNCPSGTTPLGTSSATCINSAWQPSSFGSCGQGSSTLSGPLCQAISAPSGGSVSYSNIGSAGSFQSGTVASLICSFGMIASGSTSSTCQNGIWSPPSLGQCSTNGGSTIPGTTSGTCQAPSVPLGVISTYSNGAIFGPFNSGVQLTLRCANTQQQLIGTSSSTCLSGSWQPAVGSVSCSDSSSSGGPTCSSLNAPSGGQLSYSSIVQFPPFASGTTATLKCLSGGSVSGTSTTTCSNGQWSPSLGTCSGTEGGSTCSSLNAPLGGQIAYSSTIQFPPFETGTRATLTCNSGTPVSGSSTSTCTNGQWSPQIGTCSFQGQQGTGSCAFAPSITPFGATVTYSNGGILPPFPSGTVATCSSSGTTGCNCGGTGTVAPTAVCQLGSWIPPTLSCSGGGSTGNNQCTLLINQMTSTLQQLQSLLSGSGTVGGMTCPAIVASFGQTITYSTGIQATYQNGATATMTCAFGTPTGSTFSSCLNGVWTPALGSCSTTGTTGGTTGGTGCIFPPPTPLGAGTPTYSNFQTTGPWPVGTSASFSCQSGAFPSGSMTVTCQSNGSWSTTTATCQNIG